jgi:type I restriction enzyme M protein
MAKRHRSQSSDWGSILCRLEEVTLANSGENTFEEVFKLLVAKFWAEHSHPDEPFGNPADAKETARQINGFLRSADSSWPNLLNEPFSKLKDDHLVVCTEVLASHWLSDAEFEVLDAAFEHLMSRTSKGNKGQYFTPRPVVELCVRLLQPKPGEQICDPACGSGAFLVHAYKHLKNADTSAKARLWGFDFDQRATRVARALLLFAGAPDATIAEVNSLLNTRVEVDLFASSSAANEVLTIEDVVQGPCSKPKHGLFDVILTNPPFAGEIKEARLLNSYELYRPNRRIDRDVLFIERCLDLLKPLGRMAIVLPHNKLAGESWSYARQWLIERFCVVAVIGLGRNTFLPHTHQKTSIVVGYKRPKILKKLSPEPIFFAVSEREGKDSKGQYMWKMGQEHDSSLWSKTDHDFDEVLNQFLPVRADLSKDWGEYGAI